MIQSINNINVHKNVYKKISPKSNKISYSYEKAEVRIVDYFS